MELQTNISPPIFGRCPFCNGNILVDRCIHCGSSNDYEYELAVREFKKQFENNELPRVEGVKKHRNRPEFYGRIEVTDEMWKTKGTTEIAKLTGCSTSRISELKPKKYKRNYKRRDER